MRILLPAALIAALGLMLSACGGETSAPQGNNSHAPLVLTSLPPLQAMASGLLAGTGVEVRSIPEQARSMAAQPTYFTRQAGNHADSFRQADAVISIGRLWSADPLYTSARSFNIRIVNIDASQPWSFDQGGIALRNLPVSGGRSAYFWLGPGNLIRSLNIVAADLQTLYPEQAERITANLNSMVNALIRLRTDTEQALLQVNDLQVYALAEEFDYLFSELGIFVAGYFIKQDIDWSQQDLDNLSRHLLEMEIPVVVHKWQPSADIRAAITAGGAELLVLDLMENQVDDLQAAMQGNLQGLLQAFDVGQ